MMPVMCCTLVFRNASLTKWKQIYLNGTICEGKVVEVITWFFIKREEIEWNLSWKRLKIKRGLHTTVFKNQEVVNGITVN